MVIKEGELVSSKIHVVTDRLWETSLFACSASGRASDTINSLSRTRRIFASIPNTTA